MLEREEWNKGATLHELKHAWTEDGTTREERGSTPEKKAANEGKWREKRMLLRGEIAASASDSETAAGGLIEGASMQSLFVLCCFALLTALVLQLTALVCCSSRFMRTPS